MCLPDTRVCARLPVTRMCMCKRIEGRHYYPPPVPLLNFILPPFASTYGARSERNGRVACHSIAHARREPTYTRVRVRRSTYVRVLVGALLSPSPLCASNRFTLDRLQFLRERRNTRCSVRDSATWFTRVEKDRKHPRVLKCCQYPRTHILPAILIVVPM